MVTIETASGGRAGARHLAAAAVVFCGVVSGGGLTASDHPQPPTVAVQEERGAYVVTARFQVIESPAVVLAVLTDYEQIPRFMPNVRTSVIRERFAGGALVEQEAVSRVMMFSRRVHLVLEVREERDTIRFRDVSGRSFSAYAGVWQLSVEHGRTHVTYELIATPTFDVPEFLLTRILQRDAKQMIERLRTEITTRRSIAAMTPAAAAGERASSPERGCEVRGAASGEC